MAAHEVTPAEVEKLHGFPARLLNAVRVREAFGGRTVWAGEVQVYALEGHPEAACCYAWAAETPEGGRRVYAVLGKPPIDSPEAAVRAAIVADHRAGRKP